MGRGLTPQRSHTASGTLKRINNSSMDLDGTIMALLRSNERLEVVRAITMTLSNAQIVEVRDEDVVRGLHHRSRDCAEAVRNRVRAHYTISMISSGLIGDVTYTVHFESRHEAKMSTSERANVLHEIAATLGGSVVDTTTAEITSSGLVWGIRDDEYLSALAIPDVDEGRFERDTRHIPNHEPALITAPEMAAAVASDYVVPSSVPMDDPGPIEVVMTP